MELSDHAKSQVRSIMSLPETQAWLRAFNVDVKDASGANLFTHAQPPSPETSPLPESNSWRIFAASRSPSLVPQSVQPLARKAVDLPEVRAWIRQVEHDGEIRCPIPLRGKTDLVAGKVARLHQTGHALDAIHKEMTRDHFGREHA